MKTKTITVTDELWTRVENCMAHARIFNATEFIRLALESAVNRLETKFGLVTPTNEEGEENQD